MVVRCHFPRHSSDTIVPKPWGARSPDSTHSVPPFWMCPPQRSVTTPGEPHTDNVPLLQADSMFIEFRACGYRFCAGTIICLVKASPTEDVRSPGRPYPEITPLTRLDKSVACHLTLRPLHGEIAASVDLKSNLTNLMFQQEAADTNAAGCEHGEESGVDTENVGEVLRTPSTLAVNILPWRWGWAGCHEAQDDTACIHTAERRTRVMRREFCRRPPSLGFRTLQPFKGQLAGDADRTPGQDRTTWR